MAQSSDYDDIDFLLEKKEEELRELGAMRVRSLEKVNQELSSQVSMYTEMFKQKETELDEMKQHYFQIGKTQNDYENAIYKLKEVITQKDIEISELKTTVNTYYNDLIELRDECQMLKDQHHKINQRACHLSYEDLPNDDSVNSRIKHLEMSVQKLKMENQSERDQYENKLRQKELALNNYFNERTQYKSQFLTEKESEIKQLRYEYTNLINQKNTTLKEKDAEISNLKDAISDMQRDLTRLKTDEKLEQNGIRANVQSLTSLVDVKDSIIEKLENDISLQKQEAQEILKSRDKLYREVQQLHETISSERSHTELEIQSILKEKEFEIKSVKTEYEDIIRHLQYDLKLKDLENAENMKYIDKEDSYILNRNDNKTKQAYQNYDEQIEDLQNQLTDAGKKLKDANREIQDLYDENDELKRLLTKRDKTIESLNDEIDELSSEVKSYKHRLSKLSDQQFTKYENPKIEIKSIDPPVGLQRMNTNSAELEQRLKISELENERLREQALNADKEIDRLKENIILREREIHNIKKSIANDRLRDSNGKNKPLVAPKLPDLALTFESNPNLVNEFAKMSGSSGFKYGQKGPYDESYEKLRKEFSLQQKELGLETLSEVSFDRKDESVASPATNSNNIYALIMGHDTHKPTGDIKVDYDSLMKENQDLKLVVKTMREEMESIANKLKQETSHHLLSPEDAKKRLDFDYLNSGNLKLHDLKQENEKLKDEIKVLKLELIAKSDRPDDTSALLISKEKTIAELEKKLTDKREVIVKLKEERDNLVNICSDMKIQLNSMRKNEEFRLTADDVNRSENLSPNIRDLVVSRNRPLTAFDSKTKNTDFKKRLDNLGENVKDLFSDFKAALNQNKKSDIFSNKSQVKDKVTMQPDKLNKLIDKFENIQRDILSQKDTVNSAKKSKKGKSNSRKRISKASKSPIKGIAMKLLNRDKSKESANRR